MRGELGRYLARRLALAAITFVGMTLVTFSLAQLAPGDPFHLDPEATSGHAAARAVGARDEAPLLLQYGRWLGHLARLDFGASLVDQRPVAQKLAEALPRTLLISALAWGLGHALAVPLGVWLATSRRRFIEGLFTLLWSVPSFWVAVLLLLAVASPSGLGLLPMQGLGDSWVELPAHLLLPVLCLTLPTLVLATRQLRASLSTALASDFVFAARARGVPERRVVWVHALRASLLPLVTSAGLAVPHVVGGSAVVERVYGIPGMGLLAFDAIGLRDYPTVMGVATVTALATLASMLAVDLLYGLVDPRIRLGGR